MKKVAVFPYDHYFSPLIKSKENFKEFKISQIFSLQGWGMINESVAISNKDDTMDETIVVDIFDNNIKFDFEELWIVGSDNKLGDKYLYECIERVAKEQKNIIISRELEVSQIKEIKHICDRHGVRLEFINVDSENVIDDISILYPIDNPIITVSGIDEKTNKFELQLELKNRLEKEGYKVSWISSRKENLLCGEYAFPKFMLNNNISETKKILMYNHFVKFISVEDNPDVILLGIPSGIMPNSKMQVGNFGITAFEIFNAITADFNILSIHCSGNNAVYLDRLLKVMKYKFSTEVDCINFSNISQDPFSLNKNTPIEYILFNNEFTKDAIAELTYNKCPLFDRNSYDEMYSFLIDKLSGYNDLEVL